MVLGERPLYDELRRVFTGSYVPNSLHHFLAAQPARYRAAGLENPWPLIVTTNYDDALETAFRQAREPYDVVYYYANPKARGVFRHIGPDGTPVVIRKRTYDEFAFAERPVILKTPGGIDRHDRRSDSF